MTEWGDNLPQVAVVYLLFFFFKVLSLAREKGNNLRGHETAQIYVGMRACKAGRFEPASHLHGHKGIIRAGLKTRAASKPDMAGQMDCLHYGTEKKKKKIIPTRWEESQR